VLLISLTFLANALANSYKFEILSVTLQDDLGVPRTSFARNHFVMVNVTVKNITGDSYSAEPFLMLARMTQGITMWGIGAFRGSLLSGQNISIIPGILIPTNAPTGSYNMTVFIWSNWASAGGIPIASSVRVTFTVTP
jgi:hypothetical protein